MNHFSPSTNRRVKKYILLQRMKTIYKTLNVNGPYRAERKWYGLMKVCGLEFNFIKLGLQS